MPANPIIPQYAQAAPLPDENCLSCREKSIYYPPLVAPGSGGGKNVEILEGVGTNVEDLSDSETWRFKVEADPVADLTAALTIVAKRAGVTKVNPVLLGTVIDELVADWSYNKQVTTQELSIILQGTDELILPSLTPGERTKDLTGGTITADATLTIEGDDGLGLPGSIAAASAQVLFGNDVIWGDGPDKIGTATSGMQAFLDGLSKAVQRTRAKTLTTTGGANEYFFYAVPKAFGEVTFTKGIFVGGYRRLKSVAGVLKAVLDELDVEEDILITNAEGYEEAYYIYQSEYDNKADAVTPTYAS